MNTDTVMHGFIAQEVKAILDKDSIDDFNIWSKDQHNVQELAKSRLITPLVKAVQELSAQVTALQAEVTKLKGE